MQLFLRKNGFLLFWIFAIVDVIAAGRGMHVLHAGLKPLLIPILLIAVLLHTKASKGRSLFITGLIFSSLGDIFLLAEEYNKSFFIPGLMCFLLTHLFYSWYFLQIESVGNSLLKQRPWLIFVILLYTGALLALLIPSLGQLTVPVVLYACILTGMLLCCLLAFNFVNHAAGNLFVVGTVFFVLSDSLLAIDKFYASFAYAGFFIMLTYSLAQYFIVKGFINNRSKR